MYFDDLTSHNRVLQFMLAAALCANESETPTSLQINVGRVGETLWKIFN